MTDLLNTSTALLPLFIAQIPAAQKSDILTVLLGGAALAVIANQVFTLWKTATGKFQERNNGQALVTAADCREEHNNLSQTLQTIDRAHATRTEELRKELKYDVAQIYTRIEAKADGTNNRIAELLRAVGDLGGQIKQLANGGHHAG